MTLCDLGVGATAVGSRIPVFLRSCWVWEAVDWKLIETHWSDLLRAAIPNREDALSSVSASHPSPDGGEMQSLAAPGARYGRAGDQRFSTSALAFGTHGCREVHGWLGGVCAAEPYWRQDGVCRR